MTVKAGVSTPIPCWRAVGTVSLRDCNFPIALPSTPPVGRRTSSRSGKTLEAWRFKVQPLGEYSCRQANGLSTLLPFAPSASSAD